MGLEGNGGAFTDVVSVVRHHRDIVYATMGDMAISRRDRTSYTRRDARLICVMSITLLIQYGMDVWESTLLKITDTPGKSNKKPVVRVVATPGKSAARTDLCFCPSPHHDEKFCSLSQSLILGLGAGKHIAGFIGAVNDAILHAIPPVSAHPFFMAFPMKGRTVLRGILENANERGDRRRPMGTC